jgi:diaminopimelate decarboxylase
MAGPLPLELLPSTARVVDGRLSIGGCDVAALAAEFGTPVFIYDEAHLRDRCRDALAVFGPGVAYASKAFLSGAMVRLVNEEGLCLDVASGGELFVALSAGMPAERIVLHGNNKSVSELRTALDAGVGRIVVDSFDELDRLAALVAEGYAEPSVMVRVTPGVEAHTHEFVMTGQDDSKFGFGWRSGDAVRAIERLQRGGAGRLTGLHCHIGSQVFSVENFAAAAAVMAPLAADVGVEELCVGGGLGVAYVEGETSPGIADWGGATIAACREAGFAGTVTAEPGRSIVAQAAITVYEVGTIKEVPGIRTYVSVDGGMSDNPRPVLYGSGYETFVPDRVGEPRPTTVRVVGKHCESGDVLVREGSVPADLAVGDLLATPVTGAYGYSMSSNYNRLPRPPVVFVADGTARLVLRGESFDDLLRLEV